MSTGLLEGRGQDTETGQGCSRTASEEQNNESQKQKVAASAERGLQLAQVSHVTATLLTVGSVRSGSGGERKAEAGERHQDEEKRVSDERAGATPQAAR